MATVHEMGHNLFQDHSATADGNEYGDNSCTMGGCCHDRCFNTPRAWQLGWVSVRCAGAGGRVAVWLAGQRPCCVTGRLLSVCCGVWSPPPSL